MEDKAILSTSNKTFYLQRREFSNTFVFAESGVDKDTNKTDFNIQSKRNL
jgi:Uncharacterized conserved protein (DUF2036).